MNELKVFSNIEKFALEMASDINYYVKHPKLRDLFAESATNLIGVISSIASEYESINRYERCEYNKSLGRALLFIATAYRVAIQLNREFNWAKRLRFTEAGISPERVNLEESTSVRINFAKLNLETPILQISQRFLLLCNEEMNSIKALIK